MNIGDAESSYQEGRIHFLQYQERFMRDWYAPLYRAILAKVRMSITMEEMMNPGVAQALPGIDQILGIGGANATNPSPGRIPAPYRGNTQGGGPTATPAGNYQPGAGQDLYAAEASGSLNGQVGSRGSTV